MDLLSQLLIAAAAAAAAVTLSLSLLLPLITMLNMRATQHHKAAGTITCCLLTQSFTLSTLLSF
jgi:hypothetical protein